MEFCGLVTGEYPLITDDGMQGYRKQAAKIITLTKSLPESIPQEIREVEESWHTLDRANLINGGSHREEFNRFYTLASKSYYNYRRKCPALSDAEMLRRERNIIRSESFVLNSKIA